MRVLLIFLFSTPICFSQDLSNQNDPSSQEEIGVTFKVDDVETTKRLLPENSFETIIQSKFDRPSFTYPNELKDDSLVYNGLNGFLFAIYTAYADHRPLILSPDDLWLTLCQGFGNHLVLHGKELEDQLLLPNHPDVISIRNDELSKDSPEAWSELIAGFSNEIQSYAKPEILDLVQGDFTTTTPLISTVYQITLMDAMKTFFNYDGSSGCGIPSITLLGTTEDWVKIYEDVDQFKQFGLEEWVDEVKPIIKEFVEASKGNENREFWQSIYKTVSFYGNFAMSGWVIKLYPYIKSLEVVNENEAEPWESEYGQSYAPNPYLKGKEYLLSTISEGAIPKGYVELNFNWDILQSSGDTIRNEMLLYGGFLGATQDHETMAIRPNIAWAICKKETPEDFKAERPKWNSNRYKEEFTHEHTEWLPRVNFRADTPQVYPIYNPEINQTSEEGLEDFKMQLRASGFLPAGEFEIVLMISHDGLAFLSEISNVSEETENYLYDYIQDELEKWSPAKSEMHIDDKEGSIRLLPLNWKVVLTI